MKKLVIWAIIPGVVLMFLLSLATAVGCQQSISDIVEVITIFKSQPGTPPPPGGWALGQTNPHPERVQMVFSPGDEMFLGLKISKLLKTDITFSKYTFFNKDTTKEVEVGLPGDLGPFEPGQVFLLAFQNPWAVPIEPGNYQLRVYLNNTVVASAMFEVTTRVSREAVVLVKAQLKAGGYDQISGFIISTDGRILTFHPDASEIVRWEVVLSDERSFEASVFKTHEVWGFACLKIEAAGLTPLQLVESYEMYPPAKDVENYELYPYAMRKGLRLFAAGYSMGQQTETEVEVLDPYLRLPLNPVRYPKRDFPVVKLNTGWAPGMVGGPVVNPPGRVVGQVIALDPETGESYMVTINLIKSTLFEGYTSGTVIREYPEEVVRAVFAEIKEEIRKRPFFPMMYGFGSPGVYLGFINEADPEIVEMAKAIIDSRTPGLRLIVRENVTEPPPTPPPVPQR